MESQFELIGGGFGRRELFGAGDGVLENEVHALPGTFDHPTALKDLGKTAIPRCLTIEQGLHRDLGQEAAGTFDGKSGERVPDENAIS
jgi:hypothetical protein